MARIVETDNFGGDYPNESFLNVPLMSDQAAQRVAYEINAGAGDHATRFWKVVPNDYVLVPGFEP